jgi:uncharacterized protein
VTRYGALTANVAAFSDYLRTGYGFVLGMAEPREMLRALEIIGVERVARVRSAFRLICCASHDQRSTFDRAFDAFFLEPRRGVERSDALRLPVPPAERVQRVQADEAPKSPAQTWEALRARYSATASECAPPEIAVAGSVAMLAAASRFVARIERGRSRRWTPQPRGERIGIRQTLRASLQTGGEPRTLRRLGHPLRNPKFVVLIDGSRSMTSYGASSLQLAWALRRSCRRTRVFVFSTDLREVTRPLSAPRVRTLGNLGEAWGGGTRIGSSLQRFLRKERSALGVDTIVFVVSDGLEIGEAAQLERAAHTIRGTGAAIVWINPLLTIKGFTPTARGMHAALPYLDAFVPLAGVHTFEKIRL